MSSNFQKDLYEKKGSLLTAWDLCIGGGFIALVAGVYLNHKEKKKSLSVGSGAGALSAGRSISMEKDDNKLRKVPTLLGASLGAAKGGFETPISPAKSIKTENTGSSNKKDSDDVLEKLGL